MRGLMKVTSILVLLTVFNALCSGAVTRNDGPKSETLLTGLGSIKVVEPNGKETVLDGPNGSIKAVGGPKRKETVLGGHRVLEKLRRETNSSVIEHLRPKEKEPHGLNISERVRREVTASAERHVPFVPKLPPHGLPDIEQITPGRGRRESNSSVLHRVLLTSGRVRREIRKVTLSAGSTSANITTTTPRVLGNMITVPDNCPEGKKFVNGQCKEIW